MRLETEAPPKEESLELVEELARLRVRLAEAGFENTLARQGMDRLRAEIRKLERQLSNSEAARASLRSRLGERERYVSAIHASGGWKLLQFLRGLFGRRW